MHSVHVQVPWEIQYWQAWELFHKFRSNLIFLSRYFLGEIWFEISAEFALIRCVAHKDCVPEILCWHFIVQLANRIKFPFIAETRKLILMTLLRAPLHQSHQVEFSQFCSKTFILRHPSCVNDINVWLSWQQGIAYRPISMRYIALINRIGLLFISEIWYAWW